MKLRQYLTATVIVALPALFAGCSCGSSTDDGTNKQEKISSKVIDWKAYNLGADHAKEVISIAHDESELQDALLEVRARISNIHSKLGAQSATDYERGFTEYIRTEKDSLARIIF